MNNFKTNTRFSKPVDQWFSDVIKKQQLLFGPIRILFENFLQFSITHPIQYILKLGKSSGFIHAFNAVYGMRGGRGLERLGMCECKFAPRFLSVIVVYKRIEGFNPLSCLGFTNIVKPYSSQPVKRL